MGVTAQQVAKVPAGNIRVSRVEFGRIWAYADELGRRPGTGLFAIGVLFTCDWLADQALWSDSRKRMVVPESPVT